MPVQVCTGFEFGTTAGLTTGNAGNKLFDSQFGSPSIVPDTPRTGTYCLELNPSAGEEWVQWGTDTIGSGQTRLVLAFALRFVTSLPSGDTLLAQIDTNIGPTPNIWFRTSDDKLVVHAGGGAPGSGEVAGPTVAADTWYYIELYSDCSAAIHTLDWWVDGTAQTQSTTSSSASTFFSVTIGGPIGGQTYTGRYDDVAVWTGTSEIMTPVGSHKVEILNVDIGTAYVLNGTAANWSTFTANGTIDSSFTVTEARDRTDEWPPTIGASADGLIQDATSTTDNVEIAMTTYTLAAGETIAGLRMLACGWAVSGTAATFGFRSYNGTTETILQAGTVDPSFDNSTTAPAWVCKMLTFADIDTQSELDGLRFRIGYSSDAAPDIGIHAIAAEVAVKEAAGAVNGVGLAAFTFTATAVGTPETFGTATGNLALTATATGIDRALGTAAADITFSGTASGIAGAPPVEGQATAVLSFSGSASGIPETFGQAPAALGFTGTASGIPRTPGAATGTYTVTATAAGIDRALGAAVASLGFTGTAAGIPEIFGAAAASLAFTGTANGVAGTPPVTGQATGTYSFTGTANGIDRTLGTATSSLTFSSTAAGIDRSIGAATAPFVVVATAIGQRKTFAQAAAALTFTATGTGFVGAIPIPAGHPLTTRSDPRSLIVPAGAGLITAAVHAVVVISDSHVVEVM